MATQPPSGFWLIQHPSSGGDVVAKFDSQTNGQIITDEVASHSDFNIVEVADGSSLSDKTINQSGLSESEKDLLSKVYPVQ